MSLHEASEYNRTETEKRTARNFLNEYFDDHHDPSEISEMEEELIREIVDYVEQRFSRMKYILGLSLDFVLLSEKVSGNERGYEQDLNSEQIFERYERVRKRGDRTLNTLTLTGPEGKDYGIRKIEERVLGLFHEELGRLDYPSAYVYNTGQWQKFEDDLLVYAFQLSRPGRYVAAQHLLDYGMAEMPPANVFEGNPRPRLFPRIVKEYPRGEVESENAGLIFQAITYGYIKADRPHLSIVVDKVRTGSKRQKRIGDIDCYRGLEVELSIEVKDFHLTSNQVQKELSTFVRDVRKGGLLGLVVVRSLAEEVRNDLEDQGLVVRTEDGLLREVRSWDWPKQNAALLALFHYLAHVEQNSEAVQRLQHFIHEIEPNHDVLRRFDPEKTTPGDAPLFEDED